MKKLLLALCLLCFPAFAEEPASLSARIGEVNVLLTDTPCVAAQKHIPEELISLYRGGKATMKEGGVALCWSLQTAPGAVCIVDENGYHLDIPLVLFAPKDNI